MTADGPEDVDRLAPWTVVGERRVLFEHRFHPTVLEETVRLPTGVEATWVRYDTTAHRDGVIAVCLDAERRVLLARQYNHGAGEVLWELPGGGIEADESPDDAVRRELAEEVGVRPEHVECIGAYLINPRRSPFRIHVFVATGPRPAPTSPDDTELIEPAWVAEHEVDAMIRDGRLSQAPALAAWAIYRAASASG